MGVYWDLHFIVPWLGSTAKLCTNLEVTQLAATIEHDGDNSMPGTSVGRILTFKGRVPFLLLETRVVIMKNGMGEVSESLLRIRFHSPSLSTLPGPSVSRPSFVLAPFLLSSLLPARLLLFLSSHSNVFPIYFFSSQMKD